MKTRFTIALMLLILTQSIYCNAETEEYRQNRIAELKHLIVNNTLKVKSQKLAPNSSLEETTRNVSSQLAILRETSTYSLELADLTISDQSALAKRKEEILSQLKTIEDKYGKYLDTVSKVKR